MVRNADVRGFRNPETNSQTRLLVVALVRLASWCQRSDDPLGKYKHYPSAKTRLVLGRLVENTNEFRIVKPGTCSTEQTNKTNK
jgi:hypothetical protein